MARNYTLLQYSIDPGVKLKNKFSWDHFNHKLVFFCSRYTCVAPFWNFPAFPFSASNHFLIMHIALLDVITH